MVSSLLMLMLAAGEGAFVEETVALGFPVDRGERLALAVIHEPGEALPPLEACVARDPSAPSAHLALEMIAYGGHEESLLALARLMAIDPSLVKPYVARLLDRATEPFALVTRVVTHESLESAALEWTRQALREGSRKRLRQWESAPAALKARLRSGGIQR